MKLTVGEILGGIGNADFEIIAIEMQVVWVATLLHAGPGCLIGKHGAQTPLFNRPQPFQICPSTEV